MRRKVFSLLVGTLIISSLIGCSKKNETEVPTEKTLAAVSLDQLEEGSLYVRSGDQFWKLPLEEYNFDITKEPLSTDGKQVGFVATGLKDNRILDFVYEDDAIPTLYKNDTLVYVTSDAISSFTWERYLDCGYSIGIYGFELNGSDKVTTGELSNYSPSSSMASALVANEIPSLGGIVFDKINGTPITKSFLNESAGIITGMSKDATANIDAFIGTTHVPMNAKADTRYFQAFELYNTTQYSLSTDGYAMVEIPSYLKSGYYLINNIGFVKFVNIDRGNDEASIDLTVPYYYEGEDGKLLTYYEWREANGLTNDGMTKESVTDDDTINVSDYPERMKFTIDNAAVGLNVEVDYSYKSENASQNASQTGEFPRAVLVDPFGNITTLSESEDRNDNGDFVLSVKTETAPSGDWYLLFRNFDNAYKSVSTELLSGNANTYIHNGQSGNISLYYEGAASPQVLHVTWEQKDRTATGINVKLPDGTEYTLEKNPELFNNYAGGVDVNLPSMMDGTYRIDLKGDTLGRVWVTREAVNVAAAAEGESAEATETAAAEGESQGEAGEANSETSAGETENLSQEN